MQNRINAESVFAPSENIVAREIDGEIIIVPLVSGIGDIEDELYSLNETGIAVWKRVDGKRSLKEIMDDLADEYEKVDIEDITGFLEELLKRGILTEIS